jgi:hypothetical protein
MDPVEAIGMALTPGTVFNQQNKVFRSAKALAQFANVDQGEVLSLVAENLAERVTIRPSAKRPENGPLIALTEFIADAAEPALVKIMGGNAIEPDGLGVVADNNIGGAAALLQKVEEMTGEAALEEDEVVGANDPDDEEVA